MKSKLAVCILLLISVNMFAGVKTRTYKASPSDVYIAAVKAAGQLHTVVYQDADARVLAFTTGLSGGSWGYHIDVKVTDKSVIELNMKQRFPSIDLTRSSIVNRYFDRVQAILDGKY